MGKCLRVELSCRNAFVVIRLGDCLQILRKKRRSFRAVVCLRTPVDIHRIGSGRSDKAHSSCRLIGVELHISPRFRGPSEKSLFFFIEEESQTTAIRRLSISSTQSSIINLFYSFSAGRFN